MREKERGGGGRAVARANKESEVELEGRALLIIPYANSNESCKHEQCTNKPVDIYTYIHTYLYMHIPKRLSITEVRMKETLPW